MPEDNLDPPRENQYQPSTANADSIPISHEWHPNPGLPPYGQPPQPAAPQCQSDTSVNMPYLVYFRPQVASSYCSGPAHAQISGQSPTQQCPPSMMLNGKQDHDVPPPVPENHPSAPAPKRRRKIESAGLPDLISLFGSDGETAKLKESSRSALRSILPDHHASETIPVSPRMETAKDLRTTRTRQHPNQEEKPVHTQTGAQPTFRTGPIAPVQANTNSDFIPSRHPTFKLPPLSPSPSPKAQDPLPPPPQPPTGSTGASEPVLCPEQAELVELIASGKNVFYTGSAGCGKSTVLKAFTKRLRDMGKNVRILAPTGRAALQVNGSTTWTYAGWTPDHHKRSLDELRAASHGKFVWKRFTETDVLVIDEISMVENLHFERLNEILKEARRKPHQPDQAFGGLQIIVTGDFCQLPPVKPFQHCIDCGKELITGSSDDGPTYTCRQHGTYLDEDKWAFRSKAWDECNFAHVQLKSIHRQNDQTFIRMLQKCRVGEKLGREETDLLMDHPCRVNNATKLFATRDEVARVNQQAFDKLTGRNHSYWCRDTFVWQKHHPHLQWKSIPNPRGPESQRPLRALDDHRFGECVELKKGMLVVLLVNLDLGLGLCNGSQGIVCGFEPYDKAKMPKARTGKQEPENKISGERAVMKEGEILAFLKGEGARFKVWPTVRFHNGQIRTIYAECSINELGDERPYSLLCRTQIPLAPAWAMTIHKSQSLTLDRVIVNLSKAFEEGQVYVALSRATGLQGLKIEGDIHGLQAGLGGNKEVQKFLREKFGALNDFLLQ